MFNCYPSVVDFRKKLETNFLNMGNFTFFPHVELGFPSVCYQTYNVNQCSKP